MTTLTQSHGKNHTMPSDANKLTIALAPGDGIGPEIMKAVLHIFNAAGVMDLVNFEDASMGEAEFAKGNSRGVSDEAMALIESAGIVFKGPMGTPVGGGGKSINVTLRKTFGAFANLRHFQTLPGVETVFSRCNVPIDFYVVRENVEDTYGGIEHRLTPDVVECLRLITAPGCDQVHRFAFDTAKRLGIKTVHCGHKANIMKMTDGLFLERFREMAKDYPDIETGDIIIDALCMNLVRTPDQMEMVVLPNLQGDIVSDLAAGLVGGLGFAPSANIGDKISIFEAVHGTAPDIAGQGIANPTSLLLSGLLMLRHIGLGKQAATINNALLHTLESGVHTGDVKGDKPPVNTMQFAEAIAGNLGKGPSSRPPKPLGDEDTVDFKAPPRPESNEMMRTFVDAQAQHCGADVYVGSPKSAADVAALAQAAAEGTPFELILISNRGTQVWPTGSVYTECVDHHRLRFEPRDKSTIGSFDQGPCIQLLSKLSASLEIVSFTPLKQFDGKAGYSLAQGQ